MEAPENLLKKYAGKEGPGIKDTRYAAMIEAYDSALGRLMKYLDNANLSKNTLVIFTSDNGAFGGVSDLSPLRAAKGYLYEGGIRVPTIIRMPGITKPNTTSDEPIITMDLYRTILDVCKVDPGDATCDGVSLLPVLQGKNLERDAIYFHYPNYAFHRGNRLGAAIRSGRHKLILRFDNDEIELYDLVADIDHAGKIEQHACDHRSTMPTSH